MMVWLMVQRLAPGRCTDHALQALRRYRSRTARASCRPRPRKLPVHLVVAGDGPARKKVSRSVR